MKKNKSYRLIYTVSLLFIVTLAVIAGDPVPGIDISLEQIPGGIVKTVKTDINGKFIFDKLTAGNYILKLVPQKVENHNSSRSNKNYSVVKGQTVCQVSITLLKSAAKSPFVPLEITLGPKGGRVIGQIISDVGIKEEGVK